MTWVKAQLDDDENEYVERIKELNDCSKPEAVALIVRTEMEQTDGDVYTYE